MVTNTRESNYSNHHKSLARFAKPAIRYEKIHGPLLCSTGWCQPCSVGGPLFPRVWSARNGLDAGALPNVACSLCTIPHNLRWSITDIASQQEGTQGRRLPRRWYGLGAFRRCGRTVETSRADGMRVYGRQPGAVQTIASGSRRRTRDTARSHQLPRHERWLCDTPSTTAAYAPQ